MNKVAGYLSEHILGEVSTDAGAIKNYGKDNGLLNLSPELIVFPRLTNDIRKVARFSWQLAEKNHRLPITVRGSGTSTNGSSIGKGVVLDTAKHMHKIFEYDMKQKLLRLQPGARVESIQSALRLQRTGLAALVDADPAATIGGLVASNYRGAYTAKYGDINEMVDQLEVVLASGDMLQTGRISKRELNRRKGLQTFEGDIYRSVDNLIEDHKELIDGLGKGDPVDLSGYSGIADVKRRDGSFDLTPLFIGSEGTLGIISEMIVKTEFMSAHRAVVLMAFDKKTDARDAADEIRKLEPAFADYFETEIFVEAEKHGKKFEWLDKDNTDGAVIVVGFDDFSERNRVKKAKRLIKTFENQATISSALNDDNEHLMAVRDIASVIYNSQGAESWPALCDGFYVPENRFEDFSAAVAKLATKNHQKLSLHGHMMTSTYTCRPKLNLSHVGDKQKVFKLLNELSGLVDSHGGYIIGSHGEGRLGAKFANKFMDEEQVELNKKIKDIFDPHQLLNPGVKEDVELKTLVSMLATGR